MKNTQVKSKLNRTKITKNAKALAGVEREREFWERTRHL